MAKQGKRKQSSLTPRQLEILTFIRDQRRELGYSPTMQEVADHLGVCKVTVFEHVGALEEKGFVTRAKHKARSLEISDGVRFPDSRSTLLPIAGRIAAGRPIEAVEHVESIDLETIFATRKDVFVLQVQGDSMIDEHIQDGDYVVCERREQARDGEIVVALLDNEEATLKTLFRERGGVRLQPANPKYKPIRAKNVTIQGVVVGVLRRY
jgi:repressor LexA